MNMRTIIPVGAALLFATSAFAQNPVQTLTPNNAATVTNWYTQNLHDPSDVKMDDVAKEPIVGQSNKTAPVIAGVGGLIGFGEKDTTVSHSVLDTGTTTGLPRPQ